MTLRTAARNRSSGVARAVALMRCGVAVGMDWGLVSAPNRRSMSAAALCLYRSAIASGDRFFPSSRLGKAPYVHSSSTAAALPFAATRCSGARPSYSTELGSAPLWSSRRMETRSSSYAARASCRMALPAARDAPCDSRNSETSLCAHRVASARGVWPHLSSTCSSAPSFSSSFTASSCPSAAARCSAVRPS